MKNFILHVGCQKGGSSWLYSYLKSHPSVELTYKEYHVLNKIYGGKQRIKYGFKLYVFKLFPRLKFYLKLKKNLHLSSLNRNHGLIKRNMLRRSFIINPEKYFDYFDRLYAKSSQTILTGDMTPYSCCLPSETFAYAKKKIEQRGFQVKVSFIMRDPFRRAVSQIQAFHKGSGSLEEAVLDKYKYAKIQNNGSYEKIIPTLESVFAPESIHYEFYEQLFQVASIRKLTDFLEIPYSTPDLDTRANENPEGYYLNISDDVKAQVIDFYSDTYDYIENKFGKELIDSIWERNMKGSSLR